MLVRLTVEHGNMSFVQQQKAFMVTGTQGNVYAVALLPKETCQCTSTTQCYHIVAAKMYIGDDIEKKPRVVNLRMLSKRNLKRKDKKSGRKKPRPNYYDNAEVLPAPDSEEIEKLDPPNTPVSLTPKTPAKPVSSKKTPKSKKKLQLEENTEYTTPKAGKKLRFTDDEDEVQISPVPAESSCRLPVKKT